MAEQCSQQPGPAAYARKKAMMYKNLANDASKVYADVKEEADKASKRKRVVSLFIGTAVTAVKELDICVKLLTIDFLLMPSLVNCPFLMIRSDHVIG
jgi:hypothetical protein